MGKQARMWGAADAGVIRRELGVAILGRSTATEKRALRTVAILQEEMFSSGWPVGAALGTFSNLQKRCGVGRPAFRAAMNILDAQGLVDIRRGANGGVFVSQPPASKISSDLLLFLSLTGARYRSVIEARLALLQTTTDVLISRRITVPAEIASTIDASGFCEWLASLTGNPVLPILAELLGDLHRRCTGNGAPPPGATDSGALRNSLARAVNGQDRAGAYAVGEVFVLEGGPDPDAPIVSLASIDAADVFKCDKMAAELAVRLLKAMLAREIDGESRIGSLDDLGERYGGNDLSIRQALRMLEDIGVLQCERGRTGGVVLGSGQQSAVIRGVHHRLATCGATIGDNLEIAGFLDRSVPRVLGKRVKSETNPSAAPHAGLLFAGSHLDAMTSQVTAENQLLEILASPVLAVMIRSLALQFLRLRFVDGAAAPSGGHMPAMSDFYRGMFEALGQGDAPRALQLWSQKAELMAQTMNSLKCPPPSAPTDIGRSRRAA